MTELPQALCYTDPGCDASEHRRAVALLAMQWEGGGRWRLPYVLPCGCRAWFGDEAAERASERFG